MSDRTPTSEARGGDPFRIAADTLSRAAGDDAADAKPHGADMVPVADGFLGRLAYNAGYAVSYGVVLPALLLARAVPKDNALIYGLSDGARAARVSVLGRDPAEEQAEPS